MFVYVLKSLRDGHRYAGITHDVGRRVAEHNRGKVHSTKRRRPFKLVYSEEIGDFKAARAREKFLKTAAGRRYLDYVLEGARNPSWGSPA